MSYQVTVAPAIVAYERTLAAYIGYDNIVQVQRFLVMWPCLEAIRALLVIQLPQDGGLYPPFLSSDFEDPQLEQEQGQVMEVLVQMRNGIEPYATSSPSYNRLRTALAILRMPAELLTTEEEKTWPEINIGHSTNASRNLGVTDRKPHSSINLKLMAWPKGFGNNGEIRTSRLPADGIVLCNMYGIPFVAVWDNSCMLAGEAQMWGPVPCARPSAKLDTADFHFGPVVASPDMIKNDCAIWVDCQPDTSALSDLDHLVLLLSDGGNGFVFAHIWQLRGFQSRKTETYDPMTQDAWSMGDVCFQAVSGSYQMLIASRQSSVLPERIDSYTGLNRWQIPARRAYSAVGLPVGNELLGYWHAYILEFFGVVQDILEKHEISGFAKHLEEFPYADLEV
ncbi:unnamed protein product [Penicillium bialowiezense]